VRGGSGLVASVDGRSRGGWSVCPIGTGEGKHGARGGFSVGKGKKGEKGSGGGTTRWRKGGKRGGGRGRLGHATRRRMGPGPTDGRRLAGTTRARWPRAGGEACPDKGEQGSKGGVHGQHLENMGRPRKKGNGLGLRENSVGLKNIQMV
jgi:hypothetical protein